MREQRGVPNDTLTRFSYFGSGAHDFICMSQAPDYLGYDRELRLLCTLPQFVPDLLHRTDRLVELGPGDGMKAVTLLRAFDSSVPYMGFDISVEMLQVATHTFRANRSEGVFHQLDWHYPMRLRRHIDQPSERLVFLLFGNTLLNEWDVGLFLRRLHAFGQRQARSMVAVIGLEVFDGDSATIVREYNTPVNKMLTVRPLHFVDIDTTAGLVEIFFHEERRRIEEWFVSHTRQPVMYHSTRFHLEEGARVLTSLTYKYPLDYVCCLFTQNGWAIRQAIQEGNQWMFVLESV